MRKTWSLHKDYACKKCGDYARKKEAPPECWGCANCDVVTLERDETFRKVNS